MRRFALIFALAGGLAVGAAASSAAPKLPPPRAIAAGDAYVSSAAARRNFGRARTLRIQGRLTRGYLRFDLTRLDAAVAKATLRVRSLSGRGRLIVRATSSRWAERTITFRNAPRLGRRVGSARVRRGLLGVGLTGVVSSGKVVSLALTSSGAPVRLGSRESGFAPRLDLVLRPPETLIAAGDIADCTPPNPPRSDLATAALVDQLPGTVAALGDLAYPDGTLDQFNTCYQTSWGRFKARTRPAPGNHEYTTTGASGYFAYWGAAAGSPGQGYYSYDLGPWHVVSLNSNCVQIGGCDVGSPQEMWLRVDLAAHKTKCTLAYWHHPRFSGGMVENERDVLPLWQALYDAKADLVLTGHAHNYQRFAPQNAAGVADPARGLREFVVGTGGHPRLDAVAAIPNTEVMNNTTWGVLELTLWPRSYEWAFHPVAGQTFTDSGSTACH
jgi:hypothetical protein